MSEQTTITVRPATVDLAQFCGANGRYACEAPFVRGGFRWATDNVICVRLPAPGEADTVPPDGVKFPPVDEMWARLVRGVADLPWPRAGYAMRYETVKCDEYDYDGDKCPGCTPRYWPDRQWQKLADGRVIATRRHFEVAQLPDVRYSPGPSSAPVYFRFGEHGEGLLMTGKATDIDPGRVCGPTD